MSLLSQYIGVLLLDNAYRDTNEQLAGSLKKVTACLRETMGVGLEQEDVKQAFALLAEFAAAEQDFNPITDGFYVVDYDNFRYYFVENSADQEDDENQYKDIKKLTHQYPVLQAYGRRGKAYADEVIEALRELDPTDLARLRSEKIDEAAIAPASDRVVKLDHNSAAYKEIAAAFDEAIDLADRHKPNEVSGDEHASLVAGLRAARELWRSFELSMMQIEIGILMALEKAQEQLKISFQMARGSLLVEGIKAFVKFTKETL